jgi:hypothetical protein
MSEQIFLMDLQNLSNFSEATVTNNETKYIGTHNCYLEQNKVGNERNIQDNL